MTARSIVRSLVVACAVAFVAFALRAVAERRTAIDDDDGLCGESAVAKWASPDGARVVRAKIVDCGATTDFALRITIGPSSDWLAIATSAKGAIVFDHAAPTPREALAVTWTAAREVTLTVDTRDRRLGPTGAFAAGDVHVRWERASRR